MSTTSADSRRSTVSFRRRETIIGEVFNPRTDDFIPPVVRKLESKKQFLRSSLRKHFLFREVPDVALDVIVNAMFKIDVDGGDILIKEGEEGQFFYCVETGIYEADKVLEGKRTLTQYYYAEQCFGELALLYNTPRAASVTAARPGVVWAVDRPTFQRSLMRGTLHKRKLYESLLKSVPILTKLKVEELCNVVDSLQEREMADGQMVIREGDAADGMFFVVEGQVRITKAQDEKEVELKRLDVGDYFGELALMTKQPRAASAYAVGQTKLAFLDTGAFERLLGPCIELMKERIPHYESEVQALKTNDV